MVTGYNRRSIHIKRSKNAGIYILVYFSFFRPSDSNDSYLEL
jgi:hypothetical protein